MTRVGGLVNGASRGGQNPAADESLEPPSWAFRVPLSLGFFQLSNGTDSEMTPWYGWCQGPLRKPKVGWAMLATL